jgi:hypothetical protein
MATKEKMSAGQIRKAAREGGEREVKASIEAARNLSKLSRTSERPTPRKASSR